MGERLAWLVRRDGYRISTGFVGTPAGLRRARPTPATSARPDACCTQTECPSWLYPVTMGATTIWERWDSLLEDGSINPGEMTCFNHYALGAVADWLHRTVAGLAPAAPGYKKLEIAPQPLPGMDWATPATTPPTAPPPSSGAAWTVGSRSSADVPPNTTADVRLPDGQRFTVTAGHHEWTVDAEPQPAPAAVTTSTSLAAIIDDPEAYRTVIDAFTRIDPAVAEDFRKRMAWVPNQPLFGAFSLISPAVVAEVEGSLAALNAARAV